MALPPGVRKPARTRSLPFQSGWASSLRPTFTPRSTRHRLVTHDTRRSFPRRSPALPAYRLPSPHDRTPLQRRASGLALALGVNVLLLLVLLTLGIIPPVLHKPSRALIVDLIPESHSSAAERTKT